LKCIYEVFAEGHHPSASTTTELTNKNTFLSLQHHWDRQNEFLVELHKARLTLLKSVYAVNPVRRVTWVQSLSRLNGLEVVELEMVDALVT
jgi:hypothetical protein